VRDPARVHRAGLAAQLALAAAATAVVAAAVVEPARAGRADVAALQVALRAIGFPAGPIDGISGPWTRGAVRRFQRSRHLVADGVAGPRTRRALGRRGGPRLGARAMRIGNRGWDVAALQFLLSSRGFGPGGFDGGFGPNTDAAVRRFQRAAGLAVDGLAGPATLGALRRRHLSAVPDGPVRFLRPVGGRIGDGFGWVAGRQHTGVDFLAGAGASIGAAGRGVVAFADWTSGGYGNLVVVRHRLGFESWYAHLSRISAWVGEAVVGGSRLGYVGATGRATAPHLHFEVRHFGSPIDPLPRLLDIRAARAARGPWRRLVCRPNADAWNAADADPAVVRFGRCP
jgi:peptidoglycan hydrolase-like protein with peptidoglycan-binding domain